MSKCVQKPVALFCNVIIGLILPVLVKHMVPSYKTTYLLSSLNHSHPHFIQTNSFTLKLHSTFAISTNNYELQATLNSHNQLSVDETNYYFAQVMYPTNNTSTPYSSSLRHKATSTTNPITFLANSTIVTDLNYYMDSVLLTDHITLSVNILDVKINYTRKQQLQVSCGERFQFCCVFFFFSLFIVLMNICIWNIYFVFHKLQKIFLTFRNYLKQ